MTVTIERVEVLCLQDPQAAYYRFEGSYRNVVVLVHGDNGLVGIGESDAPPEIVKAAIEMPPYNQRSEGLADIVTGQAVDDPRRLWKEMYARTQWHGRRGAAMHAISALDIAHLGPLRADAGHPGLPGSGRFSSRPPARLRDHLSPRRHARTDRCAGRAAAGTGLPPPQDLRRIRGGESRIGCGETCLTCATWLDRSAA